MCVQTYANLSLICIANIMRFLAFIAFPVSQEPSNTVYEMVLKGNTVIRHFIERVKDSLKPVL